MQSIYDRIESLIKMRGMTKKLFCEELGISTGNLGDWKRSKSTPSTNKLVEISSFFGVSLDWLILGKEPESFLIKETRSTYVWDECDQTGTSLSEKEKEFIKEYISFTRYKKQQSFDQ
ncbi:helix-turn-helix transcriptional regulator [Paenibacillus dokdonensis]|uniref:Helix-turn-helix transcriptional regulator n=1 Tax=Paenibacillus dokdonensis TaxID=2567944 RepID=A0ABU6GKZ6_9BACL|nr:helix-turn-helix transcriptional regulator [Paenibacillus dokdonensis]MEC0239395.1 helix-turn-helix transcriptional regulator [Paenibacillus dokdonensis]